MSGHDLDLHFGYTEPAVKDKRFEQLQRLSPDREKQMMCKKNDHHNDLEAVL